jgi:hypothetical protein
VPLVPQELRTANAIGRITMDKDTGWISCLDVLLFLGAISDERDLGSLFSVRLENSALSNRGAG